MLLPLEGSLRAEIVSPASTLTKDVLPDDDFGFMTKEN